jgi:hypothetical protein
LYRYITDSDVMFMAVSYIHGKKNPYRHVSVIGRAKPVKSVDLSDILKSSLKGGGHAKAASAAFRMDQPLSDPALAAGAYNRPLIRQPLPSCFISCYH